MDNNVFSFSPEDAGKGWEGEESGSLPASGSRVGEGGDGSPEIFEVGDGESPLVEEEVTEVGGETVGGGTVGGGVGAGVVVDGRLKKSRKEWLCLATS